MKIGIPKEVKPHEGRVALTPSAVSALVKTHHEVRIETAAGLESGFSDVDYQQVGAIVCEGPERVYQDSECIIKVKEPVAYDIQYLRQDHVLFCFLHLAAQPVLVKALEKIGLTAFGFETLKLNGQHPILAPMSAIAGKVAVQSGAHLLHQHQSGKGVLLGGVPGADLGHVVVLGAGVAGWYATEMAYQLGAQVTVFDVKPIALERIKQIGQHVQALYPEEPVIKKALREADLVIGAVHNTGVKTTKVVTRDMVEMMEAGSVIVDIAIDQGGCIETSKPTDFNEPVYYVSGVTHMCVSNLPGIVPKTATQALSGSLLPFVHTLANTDLTQANGWDPVLSGALNMQNGSVVLNTL